MTAAETASGRRRARRALNRAATVVAVLAVAVAGVVVGLQLGGSVRQQLGPVEIRMSLRPALTGGTEVRLDPLGAVGLRTHSGPLALRIQPVGINTAAAEDLVHDPAGGGAFVARADRALRAGLVRLAVRSLLACLAATAVLALAVFRWRWHAAAAPGAALALLVAASLVAAGTYDVGALAQPRYHGLLTYAPAVVGNAQQVVDRFDSYREQLAGLLTSVTQLYSTAQALPSYAPEADTIRVLHVSDLHLNPIGFDLVQRLAGQFQVNAVVDTGDIVDWGTSAENGAFRSLARLPVPYVYIRGNHDSASTAASVAALPTAVVLDGRAQEVAGLRIYGVGDPRFTPDRSTRESDRQERATVLQAGRQAAADIGALPEAVDVALVHDPVEAEPLAGAAPVVLAGHLHSRDARQLPSGTRLLVEGSTGGAGLRGVQGESPTQLECSVLYFDRATRLLRAYDAISVGGLGQSSVSITRTVTSPRAGPSPSGSPSAAVAGPVEPGPPSPAIARSPGG